MPPFKQAETDADAGHAARLRRIRLRCWRRGMRETDMLLGPFADAELDGLGEEGIAALEQLLEENDQEILLWVTGRKVPPEHLSAIVRRIEGSIQARNG